MRRSTNWLLIPVTLVLAGCQSCPPTKIPEPIAVPAACLADCLYTGPEAIKTNGELLESFQAQREQIACLKARIQCVRDAQPKALAGE